MNFYSNRLDGSKYLKISQNYKKIFTKEFLIQNSGLFIGDQSLYKLLINFELIKKIQNVKGDVIEFGVWNGNNLLTIKKILDYFNLKKKLFGYDHYKGMPKETKDYKRNNFSGDKKLVQYIIKFFKLKNIFLIDDDILKLKKHLKSFKKISLIYIDCDIYETTKEILEKLSGKLSKGGIIVFDEGNQRNNSGETMAMRKFYKNNKKNYKKVFLKTGYQPDIYLEKIR